MKTETRIDPSNVKRRVIVLREYDFRTLKQELVDREYTITIWLEAAIFRKGDIVVNQRTRDEGACCGRFELLEEIDQKRLRRNGVWGYYQKWLASKFKGQLRKPKGADGHGG